MTRFRKTLLTSAAAFALFAAPAAMAQQTSTTVITNTSGTADAVVIDNGRTDSVTTVTTTTTTNAPPVVVDHVAHLEAMGYSDIRQRPGVALESQIAFSAVNEWGHPVKLIVDRDTGVVVRETSMRTLDNPSKR